MTIAEQVLSGKAFGSSATLVIGDAEAIREPALIVFDDGSAIVDASPVSPENLSLPLPGKTAHATVFVTGPNLDLGAGLAVDLAELGWTVTLRFE